MRVYGGGGVSAVLGTEEVVAEVRRTMGKQAAAAWHGAASRGGKRRPEHGGEPRR